MNNKYIVKSKRENNDKIRRISQYRQHTKCRRSSETRQFQQRYSWEDQYRIITQLLLLLLMENKVDVQLKGLVLNRKAWNQ